MLEIIIIGALGGWLIGTIQKQSELKRELDYSNCLLEHYEYIGEIKRKERVI